MKSYFINEILDNAINDYISSKDRVNSIIYNSFLVVVIRMLVNIYGELDITNPYLIKDDKSFIDNLGKFGYQKDDINNFINNLDKYSDFEKNNRINVLKKENEYFIIIQKQLIDMFTFKRLNYGMNEREQKEFFQLLYTPGCINPLRLSFNYLKTSSIYEVSEYYQAQMLNKKTVVKKEKKETLPFSVYRMFNMSVSDISKLSNEEVKTLNKKILLDLDINENAVNKEYLLEKKVFEYNSLNNRLVNTGNGYVDILLVCSIVVTILMVIFIFSAFVL